MSQLEVDGLHIYYDKIHALKGITLRVEPDQIVTLIGANGAGKSTTLRAVSGLLAPEEGAIRFSGENLAELLPHQIVEMGIVHVPEGRRIFGRLTVCENLQVGAITRRDGADRIQRDIGNILDLFPRLRERYQQVAGTLSGGEQQMLAIARGLMARPSVLLLDEPSMGIAPILVDQIFGVIQAINKEGVSILLVEQNAALALQFADYAYVMESGQIALAGTGPELLGNERVTHAYLG